MGVGGLTGCALAETERVGGLRTSGGEEAVLAIGVVVRRVLLVDVGGLHEGQRRLAEVGELLEVLDRRQFEDSCEGVGERDTAERCGEGDLDDYSVHARSPLGSLV